MVVGLVKNDWTCGFVRNSTMALLLCRWPEGSANAEATSLHDLFGKQSVYHSGKKHDRAHSAVGAKEKLVSLCSVPLCDLQDGRLALQTRLQVGQVDLVQ